MVRRQNGREPGPKKHLVVNSMGLIFAPYIPNAELRKPAEHHRVQKKKIPTKAQGPGKHSLTRQNLGITALLLLDTKETCEKVKRLEPQVGGWDFYPLWVVRRPPPFCGVSSTHSKGAALHIPSGNDRGGQGEARFLSLPSSNEVTSMQ